jgi:predicted ATPase
MNPRNSHPKNNSNPFSTKFWTPGRIPYQFSEQELSVNQLIDAINRRISRNERIMQIVGAHGSGKSTLLWTLARHLEQQGQPVQMETLNGQHRQLTKNSVPDNPVPEKNSSTFFLLDGFEQLSFLSRLSLFLQFRSCYGNLLLTTHQPVFGIPILYRTKPEYEVFRSLVRQLTKSSSVPQHAVDEQTLRNIYDRAAGNFRTAFFELYDVMQEKTVCSVFDS